MPLLIEPFAWMRLQSAWTTQIGVNMRRFGVFDLVIGCFTLALNSEGVPFGIAAFGYITKIHVAKIYIVQILLSI